MSSSIKIGFVYHSNVCDFTRDDVQIALRKIIPEVRHIKYYWEIAHCNALCILLGNGSFETHSNRLTKFQMDSLDSAIRNNIPVFIPYKPVNSMADGKWKFYKMDMRLYKDENIIAGIQGSYNDIYHIGSKTGPSTGIETSVQNRNILLLL